MAIRSLALLALATMTTAPGSAEAVGLPRRARPLVSKARNLVPSPHPALRSKGKKAKAKRRRLIAAGRWGR